MVYVPRLYVLRLLEMHGRVLPCFLPAHAPPRPAPSPKPYETHAHDNQDWPQTGAITLTDVEMRYRPGLDLVLKGVNINIKVSWRRLSFTSVRRRRTGDGVYFHRYYYHYYCCHRFCHYFATFISSVPDGCRLVCDRRFFWEIHLLVS